MPVSEYTLTKQAGQKLSDHLRRTEGKPDHDLRYPDPSGRWVFMCIGKTVGAITQGESGNVTVYRRGSSSDASLAAKGSETSAERTVTAYARLGDVEADKWVYLFWMGGGWEIVNAECAE